MKPRKVSTSNRSLKQESEQWQCNADTAKGLLYQPTVLPINEPNRQQSSESGDTNHHQQQLMAQQLLMLLPGSGKQVQQDESQVESTGLYHRPSPIVPPPQMGLPPGTAAELGALLFADVVRKQLMEQAATMPPTSDIGPTPIASQLDLMYRHLAKNQPSPMILSASDIANKEPILNNGDSPSSLPALQYDAFPNQRFTNNHSSPFPSFNGSGLTTSAFCDPRPSTSSSVEQASSSVLEIDARALLAAFLHCLTSDLKRSGNSNNSDGTGSDSTPISVESDEDMPPNNGGKNGKGRNSQQLRSLHYASGSSDVYAGDNNASPKSSDGVNSNSSSSSTVSSKRSTKTGSGATPERQTATSSVSSSPATNSTGGPPSSTGGQGESSETIVQELVEEATTIKQHQQETSSKSSVNESEPFYWVQSFHAFERRNLIRTCLMQPPSQMTFDPRRQCFRRVPAVTLYRCNVCGDYTSKHRDKISRHLTLQHSIKPTSPMLPSSQSSPMAPANVSNKTGLVEVVNDGGRFGGGTEIDTVPSVFGNINNKNGNNKAPSDASSSTSSTPASNNSSPTWPVGQTAQPLLPTTTTTTGQQALFQWPTAATAANRLPLAITTDPRTLMVAGNNTNNNQCSNGAPMDLTSTTNNNGSNSSNTVIPNGSRNGEPGRTLLTVGGIIETAFYQAAAASSSSPSPSLSINETNSYCSSTPAKKMKQSTTTSNGLDLSSAGGDDSAFKRVWPANTAITPTTTTTTTDTNNNNNRQREFPCHYCPATFRLYVALRSHYAQHHPTTASARPYNCNICDFSTTQLRKLDQHQQQHHQSKQTPPNRPAAIEQAVQKI